MPDKQVTGPDATAARVALWRAMHVELDAPPHVLHAIRKVEAVCARHGIPPGAAALQFSMRDKRITSTVVGVGKPERVDETLEWASLPIAESVWEELATIPYSIENPQEGLI